MDPLTLTWLIVLAAAYFIRRSAEDGWAAVNGRTSPRIERRRAQHELAQKQRADLGRPTIGQAVTGRIAERIAEPRERGAFRRFVAELWEDSWVDAADWHRKRRARRTNPDGPTRAMASRLCAGECGRWVTSPWTHCVACEQDTTDDDPADWWADADEVGMSDDDYLDAEVIDEPTEPIDPEPIPAPEPTRKDTPVPHQTINGDTVSPLENLAFATGCMDLDAAIRTELDTMLNNLSAAGVGPALIGAVADVKAASERFGSGAMGARTEYAEHVAVQAEIAGDAELRDTVRGTYLDIAHA